MWIKGETHWRRPDLIIFINGFPLVFIELKNSNIPVKNAYDINLKNYLKDIPYLFNYNQICVLSNGMETRLGSFAAGYEFFFEWLKVENEKENPDRKAIRENCTSLEYFIAGLCEPKNLLDYIENFILYDRRRTKIIAKNHQFFGVNNAYNAFLRRVAVRAIPWLCLPERLSINVLAILPSLSLLTVKIWIRRFIRTSCVPNLLPIRTRYSLPTASSCVKN